MSDVTVQTVLNWKKSLALGRWPLNSNKHFFTFLWFVAAINSPPSRCDILCMLLSRWLEPPVRELNLCCFEIEHGRTNEVMEFWRYRHQTCHIKRAKRLWRAADSPHYIEPPQSSRFTVVHLPPMSGLLLRASLWQNLFNILGQLVQCLPVSWKNSDSDSMIWFVFLRWLAFSCNFMKRNGKSKRD